MKDEEEVVDEGEEDEDEEEDEPLKVKKMSVNILLPRRFIEVRSDTYSYST